MVKKIIPYFNGVAPQRSSAGRMNGCNDTPCAGRGWLGERHGTAVQEGARTEVISDSLMFAVPTMRLGSLPEKSTPLTTPVLWVEAAT